MKNVCFTFHLWCHFGFFLDNASRIFTFSQYIYIFFFLLHPSTHWIFFEWSLVDLQFFDPFVDFYFILFFFTLDFPQGIHNYLAIKLKSLVGVCWGNICVGGMSMKDTRSLMELIDNLSMWVPQQAPNLRDN